MEKYGVLEETDAPKTAEEKKGCPKCGQTLRPQAETGVLLCPTCGSKPFEAKER